MNHDKQAHYTIGEVAQIVGVRTSTLRYYDEIGLLPATARINGQRRYDTSSLALLKVARMAGRAGFSLDQQRHLLHGFDDETTPAERWRSLAVDKLEELDAIIARALEMKARVESTLTCACPTITDCAATEAEWDR